MTEAQKLTEKAANLLILRNPKRIQDAKTWLYGCYLATSQGNLDDAARYFKNLNKLVADMRPARAAIAELMEVK